MDKLKSLSVFFPAHNEEKNIGFVVEKTLVLLPKIAKEWEVIVVNDGSTDRTAQVVKKLSEKEPRVKLITHDQNRGYGEALKSGFYQSKYDWILFTDGDGQFDISEATKFLQRRKQAEVVIGYRVNRHDPFIRKLFGWGWNFLANLLLGINVRDVDCGFKLVKKQVIDTIPKLTSTRGAMIEPELLAKAKRNGFKIVQVGVHHYPRKKGRQTGVDFNVILNSFFDLARLWWQLR